jgi:hypothetical protein
MIWSITSILAWIAVAVGLSGVLVIILISISERRHKDRLRKMHDEAEARRRDYLDISPHFEDWTPSEKSNHRAKFLP